MTTNEVIKGVHRIYSILIVAHLFFVLYDEINTPIESKSYYKQGLVLSSLLIIAT